MIAAQTSFTDSMIQQNISAIDEISNDDCMLSSSQQQREQKLSSATPNQRDLSTEVKVMLEEQNCSTANQDAVKAFLDHSMTSLAEESLKRSTVSDQLNQQNTNNRIAIKTAAPVHLVLKKEEVRPDEIKIESLLQDVQINDMNDNITTQNVEKMSNQDKEDIMRENERKPDDSGITMQVAKPEIV